ncbi:MAG: hypothetical protein AVDCRST_MAG45-795, partial [uncultured Solirubrobacterales bacterium]
AGRGYPHGLPRPAARSRVPGLRPTRPRCGLPAHLAAPGRGGRPQARGHRGGGRGARRERGAARGPRPDRLLVRARARLPRARDRGLAALGAQRGRSASRPGDPRGHGRRLRDPRPRRPPREASGPGRARVHAHV